MSIIIQTVPNVVTYAHEEIHGFRRAESTLDHFTGQRMLQCAWDDRWYLYKQLLGTIIASGTTLIHRLPQRFPGVAYAYAHRINVTPAGAPIAGGSSEVLTYEKARLLVEYETARYSEVQHEVLVEEHLEPSVEFLTLPNAKLYWDDAQTDPLRTDEAPGVPLKMIDWVYTLHFMPIIQDEVLTLVGCCNNADVYSHALDMWFYEGTLLYSYPSLDRQTTTEGVKAWDITMRFTWRPEGWNNFPKRGEGISFKPIYDGNGDLLEPFPPVDLSVLLL
ncbi:MAG: hypothetical protein ACTSQB_00190 [Candidatus Heimdallarchaeota archaeon]